MLVGASPIEAFTVWLPAAVLSVAGAGFGLEFSERRRTSDVWLSYWAWHGVWIWVWVRAGPLLLRL